MTPNSRLTLSADFPASTVDRCIATLVQGLDGYSLSSGAVLTCSDRIGVEQALSDPRTPILALTGFQFANTIDGAEQDRIALTVLGLLKVKAPKAGEGPAVMRRVIDDLFFLVDLVRGLPVDRDGRLYPNDEQTPYRYDRGEMRELVDQGGPYLRTGQIVDIPGSPYATANLSFAMSFYQAHDRRIASRVRVAVLGVRCVSPWHVDVPLDYNAASPADTPPVTGFVSGAGQHDTPAPDLDPAVPGDPPLSSDDPPHALGADPARLLRSINVTPYTLALAALATQQASAIGVYDDDHAETLTAPAWASSNEAVATVSSTGLVTGVAAGTANITATLHGITSNACAVTVS